MQPNFAATGRRRLNRIDTLRKRTKGRCGYCGVRLEKSEMTRDHIIPRAKGGETKSWNLMCCCQPCNERKADHDLEVFRGMIGGGEFWFEECDREASDV